MKKLLILISLFSFITSAQAEENRTAGIKAAVREKVASPELIFDGRPYELHFPPKMEPGKKYPLVMILHGGGGSSNHIQRHLNFGPAGDRHGFIVAYLNGNPAKARIAQNMRTWNGGGGCCGRSARENLDDVTYLDGFIKSMVSSQPVDASRIYMAGHSNGAIMTYRYACERPGVLAAIVPMAGALMLPSCAANNGLRVLHIHGDDDRHVLVGGGYGPDAVVEVDFTSCADTQERLMDAGASFNLKIVPGAGHSLDSLNQTLLKTDKKTLAETVASFLDQK